MPAVRSTRPPPPPPAPPKNSRFGPYTLLDRLAVGGMAEVFRAMEPRPVGEPRVVVLKRMLPHIAAEPGARRMFQAEAELGAHVRHPNVVEVLGVGAHEGQPFLALEYVRGVDLWRLTRWMTREGRVPGVALSVFLMVELLRGLQAVHEATAPGGRSLGIVHRDVSPSNVLLSIHGDVKLGDFGIAHAQLRESHPQAPLSAHAKGKLGYLAPEQVAGAPLDRRADVFSAGIIAAELLMGRPLFAGGSELAVLLAIRDAKIHPFLEIRGTLPRGLGEAVVEALARDPDARIASAGALAERLLPFLADPPSALRRQLAELVKPALRAATWSGGEDAQGGLGQADGMTPTVDVPGLYEGRTPVRPGPPTTADIPVLTYEVRSTEGRTHGPWTYAELVQHVATGRLAADDLLREADGPWARLGEVASVRRHLPPSTMTPTTERLTPGAADEMVPLAWGGVVTALCWSALRRDTGLWLCEAGGARKEIYLEDGVPQFVTSNMAGELLGEYLVARGVISRGELDMALAVMPRFEGKLGDTLAALGLVEPVHLFQHIATQVREKLLDLFTWDSGQAELYLGVPPPEISFPLDLDPWAVLDEGIRRRVAQGLEDERFGPGAGATLQQVMDVPREVSRAPLPPFVRRLLATVHRPTALGELEAAFDAEEAPEPGRTRRALVLLFHMRAIEWTRPAGGDTSPRDAGR